jgi:hypothetical protein
MAGGCSNRASIVVSIAWQHRDVLPTGMMLAPVCSDRLLPGRAMHCICRAIHWDRPGICCLGNPDRVVNVRLEFMSRVADAKRRSCHSDARCRACVIAGRCRDLAAYRLPLAVNAQKQYYSELVWMSLWCLQHASTMSERGCGWWGTIVCRLVV